MMKEYMNWPTDLLPEKPMSEEAIMQWLNGWQAGSNTRRLMAKIASRRS
jgi:hypothetical protein